MALIDSAAGNGNDFGIVEDARKACAAKELGGVVASLVKKKVLWVADKENNFTQFVWNCEVRGASAPRSSPVNHDRPNGERRWTTRPVRSAGTTTPS